MSATPDLPPTPVSPSVIDYLKSRITQLTIENEELKIRLRMQISANISNNNNKSQVAEKFLTHIGDLVMKQQITIQKLDFLSQKLINEKPKTNKKRKTISNDKKV